MVSFIFSRKNHTVTQSSFYSPCEPLYGGIDTGLYVVMLLQFSVLLVLNAFFGTSTHAVEEGQAVNGSFSFNVTSVCIFLVTCFLAGRTDFVSANIQEEPTWYYCRQTGHCQLGMVFAVNPNEDQTFDEFLERAIASPPSS